MELKAKDLMNQDVICAREDMTIVQFVQLLQTHQIRGAPVIDADRTLIGVVSITDVILKDEVFGESLAIESDYHAHSEIRGFEGWEEFGVDELDDLWVRDIMSPVVKTVQSSASLEEVAEIMYSHHIHRVIIVDDGYLAGIVTTMDILKAVMERKSRRSATNYE